MISTRTAIINALARAANATADGDFPRAARTLRGLFMFLRGAGEGLEVLRLLAFAQNAAALIDRGLAGRERDGWAVRVHAALSRRMLDAIWMQCEVQHDPH